MKKMPNHRSRAAVACMLAVIAFTVQSAEQEDVITTTEVPIAAVLPGAPQPAGTDTSAAAAQTNSVPDAIAPAAEKLSVEPSTKKDLINVAVDNETLENVVNMFTRITGANIVATSANLTGNVTVNLKDVEWKAALSSILDLHNLALLEKMPGSGVYSIVTKPPQELQPMMVETVFLNYTTTAELKPLLTAMISSVSSNATIMELASRNALVFRSTEANLREIKQLVQRMDIPSKQVCVEARFMELNENASKELGIRWDALQEFGLGLQAGPFAYNRQTSRGTTRNNTATRNVTYTDTDATHQQFRMNGDQFEEVRTEFVEAPPGSGSYLAQSTVTPTRQATYGTDDQTTLNSSDVNQFSRTITENQAAILDMDSLDLVLSALQQTAGAQIISNPKLIVTSGSEDATFSVGSREPIIKTERTEGTQNSPGDKLITSLDTSPTTDFIKGGYLETGISLKVVPVVKTDDMIEAQVWPRLMHKTADKTAGDNSWPVLSVKEIKSKFTLRSGQTVAIGGLTQTDESKAVTKVPLLGDLPLLGKYLFTHTSDQKSQVETIIFVTLSRADPAQLKENAGMPEDADLVYKRMLQAKIRREEVKAEVKKLEDAAEKGRERKASSSTIRTRK
jgi:type II secretory pathway component GspD/PulD (secretin)